MTGRCPSPQIVTSLLALVIAVVKWHPPVPQRRASFTPYQNPCFARSIAYAMSAVTKKCRNVLPAYQFVDVECPGYGYYIACAVFPSAHFTAC